jgi:DNA-binding transcriptional MocR family regulator
MLNWREALLGALQTNMPEGTGWTEPRGGLQVWLTLPTGVGGHELRAGAHARGLVYQPGESCYRAGGGEGQLALSFANQSPETIFQGVAQLAEIIDELGRKSSRRATRRTKKKGSKH